MVELVDTLDSGSSEGFLMQVQVLFSAPLLFFYSKETLMVFNFCGCSFSVGGEIEEQDHYRYQT